MFELFSGRKQLYTVEFKYQNNKYQLKALALDENEIKKILRRYLSDIHKTTIYSISDVYIYHSVSTKEIRKKYKKLNYSVKNFY